MRTKQAEMETAITNASDTPALETLYTYTEIEKMLQDLWAIYHNWRINKCLLY